MTKRRCSAPATLVRPLGSAVFEKSRFERYFASLVRTVAIRNESFPQRLKFHAENWRAEQSPAAPARPHGAADGGAFRRRRSGRPAVAVRAEVGWLSLHSASRRRSRDAAVEKRRGPHALLSRP